MVTFAVGHQKKGKKVKIEDNRALQPPGPSAETAENATVWLDPALRTWWFKTVRGFFSLSDGSGPLGTRFDKLVQVTGKVVIES